MMLPLFWNAV
jgi:hypothetical protein